MRAGKEETQLVSSPGLVFRHTYSWRITDRPIMIGWEI
jgi:hypothetical protein